MSTQRPVTAILIGAGDRGRHAYGRYARENPHDVTLVAVAEPDPARRAALAAEHNLPPDRCFDDWAPLFAAGIAADAVLVCTQDQLHAAPALAALARGHHVLLEKPMATTLDDCRALVAAAERAGRHLHICHVLRHAPFFETVHAAVQSGALGEIVTLSLRENVSYWHMAHSFVRGNWRNAGLSSPMILAKCCHDLDLLTWFVGAPAQTVASVGSLRHFRPNQAPPNAPARCADGCPVEADCLYSALDIYVRLTPMLRLAEQHGPPGLRPLARLARRRPALVARLARHVPALRPLARFDRWPVTVLTPDTDYAGRLRAVQDPANPYGRCVYQCDNDVVDHQHVAIAFANGVTATLIMHGHSFAEGRTLRIDGTRATLLGHMYAHDQQLTLHDKRTGRAHVLYSGGLAVKRQHGGGDDRLMAAFVAQVRRHSAEYALDSAESGTKASGTTARNALESHLMAFAAEIARVEQRVVQLEELR